MTDHSNTTPILKQLKGYGKYDVRRILRMTLWKECTRKHSTSVFLPILRTFHQVLGIALCIMFTINNNDIASNMLIVIVFYAISLSLMVNIKIHTYISYLNDGP